jgi:hypothetical protein
MKNVTITIDDETYRAARIRAAELGTSLSAMVKDYLQGLIVESPVTGVREMPMPYIAEPRANLSSGAFATKAVAKNLKSRQPGALKGKIWIADDFDVTPEWVIDAFEGKDAHLPWPDPE